MKKLNNAKWDFKIESGGRERDIKCTWLTHEFFVENVRAWSRK